MQNEQPFSENFNVFDGEVERNRFDGNNAPVFKDNSGSVTINNTTYVNQHLADLKESSRYNLGEVRNENPKTASNKADNINSSTAISLKEKLSELFAQKKELEIKLEHIDSEISQIKSVLKSETNPNLTILLHWLSGRKELAEKYGKIALRGFQDLRREVEAEGNLDDFYFEVENYLESNLFFT